MGNSMDVYAIMHGFTSCEEMEEALRKKYKEIQRLDSMLREASIPHEFKFLPSQAGFQIEYDGSPNRICSIIEHSFSYGHEEDLLEIMGLLTPEELEYDSVLGMLSADDVFERISKHYNAQS